MDEPASSSPESKNNITTATLSAPTKIICWILPVLLAFLTATSPTTAALLPLILLPTLLLLREWNRTENAHRASLDTMIRVYIGTGTIGIVVLVAVQSLVVYAFALLLFRGDTKLYLDEFARQSSPPGGANADDVLLEGDSGGGNSATALSRELASRPEYFIFLVLFTFIGAGALEEGLKYAVLMLVRRFRPHELRHASQFITLAVASSLGFATIENLGFVSQAVKMGESPSRLTLTVCERVTVGAPLHAMAAWITAIQSVRGNEYEKEKGNKEEMQKLGVVSAIWRSTLLHGLFDLGLFSVSAFNGNIGWVHPTDWAGFAAVFTIAVGVGLLTWMVIRRESQRYQIGLRLGL